MKKLMTTVSAVALAFGLHATDTGTSFEGLTGDAPYDIYASTGELTAQAANQTYWVTNGTEALTVVAGTSVTAEYTDPGDPSRPDQYIDNASSQGKYLSIKTTLGNPVTRNVSVGGAGTSIGDGFYFDSLVKFTAFDEDPAIDLDGGKLAVWLKEVLDANDNPTATNLVVTAGFLDGLGGVVATNYPCTITGVDFSDGGWHRVTVKAIASIYSGETVPGFVVYVDGVYAKSTAAKGIDTSALTDNAYAFNSDGALFPSADQSSGAISTISAVAFDGQGDVDDLVFTATAPAFAKDNEFFTIELGANVESLTYSVLGMGLPVTITETTRLAYVPNMGITVTGVTYANGYMSAGISTSASVTLNEGYYYPGAAEQSITANAKAAGAAINGTPYETAAAAFAAITAGTAGAGPFTVTLNTAATSGVELDSASASVVLDLAGNNITAGENDTAAITLVSGTLLVTNSTVTVGQVNGYDNGSAVGTAVYAVGDALTIAGGIYNGAVDISGATTKLITGGSFSVNENKDTESATVPPAPNAALAAAAAAAGNELVVGSGSASYYIVQAKTAATVNVTVTGGANATPAWTVNDTPVNGVPATLTEGDTYSVVYTANTGYAFEPDATTNATGTAGTTDIAITISDAVAATYKITCELGGGTQASGSAASYTYDSAAAQTVTIVAPTYEGGISNFIGWTISPVAVTTNSNGTVNIPAGQTGDITLTANWEAAQSYPTYIDTSDSKIKGQYDDWATANEVPAGANNYEAAFLLNVAPGLVGATLNATAVSISGTTVTIDINRGNLNGYVYVKKAATLAGLKTAVASPVEVTPADGNSRENKIDNGGRITQTDSGATMFYQIGVQSTPVAVPNN